MSLFTWWRHVSRVERHTLSASDDMPNIRDVMEDDDDVNAALAGLYVGTDPTMLALQQFGKEMRDDA